MLNERFDPAEKEALRQAEIEQCLEHLKSGDIRQRKAAIKRLGQLQAAPEAILPFLGDIDQGTRLEAIDALGNFNEVLSGDLHSLRPEVIAHLAGALNDPNKRVISATVRSLGMLQAKEATLEIRELLDDENPFVVYAAIVALARLEDHASLEKILTFLEDRSPHLRQATWHALSIMNYTPAIPRLLAEMKAALETSPLSPQTFALMQEYIIVCKYLKVTAAVPLLLQIIQSEVGLRTKAVETLLRLDIEKFPQELLGLLDDPNPRLRDSILKLIWQTRYALPYIRLRKLLNDDSPNIRYQTLDLVCLLRELACVPTVRFLCYRDSALYVRSKAIAALVDLTSINALPDLQALAFDAHPDIRSTVASSISKLGVPLPPQAISILEHLRNDDEAREIVDVILQTLPDRTAPSEPLASPQLSLPIPHPWSVTRQDFLTACMEWHVTLSKAALDDKNAEEALGVQSALSSLIVALSRGQ